MKKKLKDLTKEEYFKTCRKHTNGYVSDCNKKCPLYGGSKYGCKINGNYMKKYGEKKVKIDD